MQSKNKGKKGRGPQQAPQIYMENDTESAKLGECLINIAKKHQFENNILQSQNQNQNNISSIVQNAPKVSVAFNKSIAELRIYSTAQKAQQMKQKYLNNNIEIYQDLPFLHSDTCSASKLAELNTNSVFGEFLLNNNNPIKVAACAFMVDQKDNLLLTKRSVSLRSFPSCWVAPGGRVDPDETILNAMKREVLEEVGINIIQEQNALFIDNDNVYIQPVCLYESISPQKIEEGLPQYQNLVIFYAVKILEKSYNDSKNLVLNLQSSEIDMAAWVNLEIVEDILIKQKKIEEIIEDAQTPQKIQTSIPVDMIFGRYPNNFGEGLGEAHEKGLVAFLQPEFQQKFKNGYLELNNKNKAKIENNCVKIDDE